MTDTTDIKAMREFLECEIIPNGILRNFANKVLSQLEAERQRADYLQRINGIQETTIEVFRHKELAELKGDQVPLCFVSEEVIRKLNRKEYCYGFMLPTLDTNDRFSTPIFTRPLFTAPQKPVVLPKLRKLPDLYMATYHESKGFNEGVKASKAAIQAAGCIVKDGE